MQNNKWIAWILLVALGVGVLMYLSGTGGSKYNWNRTLRLDKSEPYDLSLFYSTLKETAGADFREIPQKSSIAKYKSELLNDPSSVYFYIGDRFYLTHAENEIFNSYVNTGGTLFISCSGFPENLMNSIPGLADLSISSIFADSVKLRFHNAYVKPAEYTFYHVVKNKSSENSWHYFSESDQSNGDSIVWDLEQLEGIARVSSIEQFPDFIRIKYGLGLIYLHCNPVLFSNLYLKTEPGRNYMHNVFRHIPEKKIWFDRSAGLVKVDADMGMTRESVMQYIRKFPGLHFAWLTLCLGIVLFILFGGRRTQRAIPVIEKAGNNTLAFVHTIGYFYFKEKNNKYILEKSWNQFLFFVKQHYRLNPAIRDEGMLEKLSAKSGVDSSLLEDIFSKRDIYRLLTQISSDELKEMENTLQQFYNKTKY